jgi:hypothetical protein
MCAPAHSADLPGRPSWHVIIRIERFKRSIAMLYTVAVVLIVLWLLGLVTSYTMGGLIHVLLVIAVVVVLLRLISGRSAV